MEEKKFDPYQFIGFILIALILTWMLYRNGPEQENEENKANIEQVSVSPSLEAIQDSVKQQQKVITL